MSQPAWDFDFFPTPVAAAGDPNTKDELWGKQPTNWICSPEKDRSTAMKPFTSAKVFWAEAGSTWQLRTQVTFIL